MPIEIKNLSIKVQVNGQASQSRKVADGNLSKWSQKELSRLIEESLKNEKER